MFTHLMDEPFYERMSMFFVFLGVFFGSNEHDSGVGGVARLAYFFYFCRA